jgi:hypothetical protein
MTKSQNGSMALLAGLCALVLVGCAGPAPTHVATSVEDPAGQESQLVQGYPIARDLQGILTWRDLDTVVIMESLSFEDPVELSPGLWEGMAFVVTPVRATVDSSLFGKAKQGDSITFVVAGGTVGSKVVRVSDELAPSLASLQATPTIIVGGQLRETPELGWVLDPLFVYGLSSDDMATSLLSSGGAEAYPEFALADLVSGLNDRQAASR